MPPLLLPPALPSAFFGLVLESSLQALAAKYERATSSPLLRQILDRYCMEIPLGDLVLSLDHDGCAIPKLCGTARSGGST
jgi:hypothetical protein